MNETSSVVFCCDINNTRDCNEHLFGKNIAGTGCYQLLIFGCTESTHEDAPAHNLGALYFDDLVSYNSLTTSIGQVATCTGRYQLPIYGCTKCTHEDAPAHNLGAMMS